VGSLHRSYDVVAAQSAEWHRGTVASTRLAGRSVPFTYEGALSVGAEATISCRHSLRRPAYYPYRDWHIECDLGRLLMSVDDSGFVGYLGRRSHKGHLNRIYARYKFLRDHFGLGEDEAWKLARELETWWHDSSQRGN